MEVSIEGNEHNRREKEIEKNELNALLGQLAKGLKQKEFERNEILPAGISTSVKRAELQKKVEEARQVAEKCVGDLQLLKERQSKLQQELKLLEKEGLEDSEQEARQKRRIVEASGCRNCAS